MKENKRWKAANGRDKKSWVLHSKKRHVRLSLPLSLSFSFFVNFNFHRLPLGCRSGQSQLNPNLLGVSWCNSTQSEEFRPGYTVANGRCVVAEFCFYCPLSSTLVPSSVYLVRDGADVHSSTTYLFTSSYTNS